MLVEIHYTAVYEYDSLVTVNDNKLRVFPREEYWQEPVKDLLETEPPGRVVFFRDRFGNRVARVRITVPHTVVKFHSISVVRLTRPYKVEPPGHLELPIDKSSLPPDVQQFLYASPLVDPRPLLKKAKEIVNGIRRLDDALPMLTKWVYERIEYKRGFTDVHTMAHEVIRIGKGVCQDKAHLLIGFLRALGVPARYVSGALTDTPGETHAWVEVYWPGVGWVPVDPTHNRVYDLDRHYVKYAHGRDYSDVPPINGYFISRRPGRIKTVRVEPRKIED